MRPGLKAWSEARANYLRGLSRAKALAVIHAEDISSLRWQDAPPMPEGEVERRRAERGAALVAAAPAPKAAPRPDLGDCQIRECGRPAVSSGKESLCQEHLENFESWTKREASPKAGNRASL